MLFNMPVVPPGGRDAYYVTNRRPASYGYQIIATRTFARHI